ncbi:TetR/AcrR family transcriptional regulator [Streptomyces sp. NPDC007355]|uniref:TetR/AcrR family transcriptional regulator n=1 Tax=Streptomyces sp. NPDC007355 TaxID=3364778 RepID=UPI0036BEE0C6
MLFAERGVDEVTTRQIADEAGIGTGTSFPSAETKGELLMLIQNSLHAEALAHGRADAENTPDALGAVMAITQRVVTRTGPMSATGASTCARWPSVTPLIPATSRHWPSPRAPRRPSPPRPHRRLNESDSATPARVVSAVLFLAGAASVNATASGDPRPAGGRTAALTPVALRPAALPPTRRQAPSPSLRLAHSASSTVATRP